MPSQIGYKFLLIRLSPPAAVPAKTVLSREDVTCEKKIVYLFVWHPRSHPDTTPPSPADGAALAIKPPTLSTIASISVAFLYSLISRIIHKNRANFSVEKSVAKSQNSQILQLS